MTGSTNSKTNSQPPLDDVLTAARSLLGWKLVHETSEGVTSGYIVETEAYRSDDPASHSFAGETKRTAPMFREAGTIYVYFTYGMHYCVNIVCGQPGHGAAVLIRALEPVDGITLMEKRRGIANRRQLTSGPAKLTRAMGIGPGLNGAKLGEFLYLEPGFEPKDIVQTTRVGITKAVDKPWRFYVAENAYISKR